jgi:hypothetical protein
MDSINWRYLFSHPSELVRLDERLKLKDEELNRFNDESFGWTYPTAQENHEHRRLIRTFRYFINVFGVNFFKVQIFSEHEIINLPHNNNFWDREEFKHTTGYFNDFEHNPREMLEIYIKNIADKRQTCEIFKKFILLTLSNYQIDLPEQNEEKDRIMQEILENILYSNQVP